MSPSQSFFGCKFMAAICSRMCIHDDFYSRFSVIWNTSKMLHNRLGHLAELGLAPERRTPKFDFMFFLRFIWKPFKGGIKLTNSKNQTWQRCSLDREVFAEWRCAVRRHIIFPAEPPVRMISHVSRHRLDALVGLVVDCFTLIGQESLWPSNGLNKVLPGPHVTAADW